MRITILTYLESEGKKTYDAVVEQVAAALARCGHETSILGVHGELRRLQSGLLRRRPELVFNLMEMFGNNVSGDVSVAGILDALGLAYTGGGPGELFIQADKALAKKLLAFDAALKRRCVRPAAPRSHRNRNRRILSPWHPLLARPRVGIPSLPTCSSCKTPGFSWGRSSSRSRDRAEPQGARRCAGRGSPRTPRSPEQSAPRPCRPAPRAVRGGTRR